MELQKNKNKIDEVRDGLGMNFKCSQNEFRDGLGMKFLKIIECRMGMKPEVITE